MRKILPYLFIVVLGAVSFYASYTYKKNQLKEEEPLAGFDKNQNGIRDDLDPMVTTLSNANPEVGKAYVQLIKTMQEGLLLKADAKEAAIANLRAYQKGVDCVFSFDPEQKISGEIIKRIHKQLLNNEARRNAQEQYSQNVKDVEIKETPWQERYKSCEFDRTLPNYVIPKEAEGLKENSDLKESITQKEELDVKGAVDLQGELETAQPHTAE